MNTWSVASIHRSVHLSGASVKGPVVIGEGVQIMPGATLEGPSYIGPKSFIGHNALIRPYTAIGAGAVLGQCVETKNCVVFPGVEIGRLSFIGDSVIGEGVHIGSGVMTINQKIDGSLIPVSVNGETVDTGVVKLGSFVGDHAVIGASNTLAAGSIVGPKAVIDHNATLVTSTTILEQRG
jgi:bifunctional UDP-N-acetylglucosamine pyrophosphorylase/glucosamine-1-phosphate N-acetyltransferase